METTTARKLGLLRKHCARSLLPWKEFKQVWGIKATLPTYLSSGTGSPLDWYVVPGPMPVPSPFSSPSPTVGIRSMIQLVPVRLPESG